MRQTLDWRLAAARAHAREDSLKVHRRSTNRIAKGYNKANSNTTAEIIGASSSSVCNYENHGGDNDDFNNDTISMGEEFTTGISLNALNPANFDGEENYFDETTDVPLESEHENYWDEFGDAESNDLLEDILAKAHVVNVNRTMWDFMMLDMNESLQFFLKIFGNDEFTKGYPVDADQPVFKLPESVVEEARQRTEFMSKRKFSEGLSNIQSSNGINDTALLNIIKYFSESIPGFNLPISAPSKSGNITLQLGKYTYIDYRKHKVHVCPKGCIAYTNNYKALHQCPNCNTMRFTPCRYNSHTTDEIARANCNPFGGGYSSHSVKYRIPQKAYFYRALIPLLQHSIEWSYNFHNGNIFAYSDVKAKARSNAAQTTKNDIEDILDAEQAILHSAEMHIRFLDKYGDNSDVIEVSLMLSEFYDGGSLFDRNSLSIWPLVISILNCNPSDRITHGIGLYLVGLHDLSCGTAAEQSMYTELLIPELKQLGMGILFEYTKLDGSKQKVFLQARLIVHQLDTKALEKVARIQGNNN